MTEFTTKTLEQIASQQAEDAMCYIDTQLALASATGKAFDAEGSRKYIAACIKVAALQFAHDSQPAALPVAADRPPLPQMDKEQFTAIIRAELQEIKEKLDDMWQCL